MDRRGLKRSDWGEIATTARKTIRHPFRQVSIDSIFFRGTLKTQAQQSSRIDFFGLDLAPGSARHNTT
jgi:hypothetical protein